MCSGIYTITNLLNGKRYVGSAVNLRKRLNNHRSDLRNNRHHSRHLQSAWNKKGDETFQFSTLLTCAKSDLLFYEQRAIDVLKPEYNLNPKARSALGCKWTEESKSKKSAFMMGKRHHIGFTHSEEAKAKMRAAKLGRKLTAEHKSKIGAQSRRMWTDPEYRNNVLRNRGSKRWGIISPPTPPLDHSTASPSPQSASPSV